MLSAPAHIPAITPSSFGAGFAAPDLIRGVVIDTFSAMICGRPVCSASPSSGTSPACRHEIVLVEARGAGGEPVGDSH